MAKELKMDFEVSSAAKIPTKKILIIFCVWNNETHYFFYDYTVKDFEIYGEETDLKKLCQNEAAFKEGYINGKIGRKVFDITLVNFYPIDHLEV